MFEMKLEFEPEDAMTVARAMKCMEDERDEDFDYADEFVVLLCERYLDQKKGEGKIYETDPDVE